MTLSLAVFIALALLAIVSSILVITQRNLVSSAFSLVMVFFSLAVIFALYGAHLLAALQVLIYAGAIMVLFVFVIMLLGTDLKEPFKIQKESLITSIAGSILSLLLMVGSIGLFYRAQWKVPTGTLSVEQIQKLGGNTRVLSVVLFSDKMLLFILSGVILTAAVVCVMALAKRRAS